MNPQFFKTGAEFRKWLEQHHANEPELLVGYYKIGSGKESMTWSESVDEALCFGWIDGVRRSVDEVSYSIRFTPRKINSIWSNVNINKVENLIKRGLMQPAGLKLYQARKENKSGIYAFENDAKALPAEAEKLFRANQQAWDFFNKQAPSYQKIMIHHIVTAKQETTKQSRLAKLIQASEDGKRI